MAVGNTAVDPSIAGWVRIDVPEQVVCGIYFLYDGPLVVYVGQSVNVYSRVANHRESKAFTAAHAVPVPPSDLDRVEAAFIRHFQPRLNKVGLRVPEVGDAMIIAKYLSEEEDLGAEIRLWMARFEQAWRDIGKQHAADVKTRMVLARSQARLAERGYR